MNEPVLRVEPLTKKEKFCLVKNFLLTLIIGIFIGCVLYFILNKFRQQDFIGDGTSIGLIIFSIFFYGILVFIVGNSFFQIFQTQKRVYSGVITDKKTEVSTFGMAASDYNNNRSAESFYIFLNNKKFAVSTVLFNQCKVNDEVDIIVLKNDEVLYIINKNPIKENKIFENKRIINNPEDLFSSL